MSIIAMQLQTVEKFTGVKSVTKLIIFTLLGVMIMILFKIYSLSKFYCAIQQFFCVVISSIKV